MAEQRAGAGLTVENVEFSELHLDEPPLASSNWKTVYRAEWRKSCQREGVHVAVLALVDRHSHAQEVAIFEELGRHPHLCRLLGTAVKPGHYFIVMECAEMGSLDAVLNRLAESGAGRPADEVLLTAGEQICEAMQMLGERNIIHTNLTAHNCLVFAFNPKSRRDVLIKVTDMRLAVHGEFAQVINIRCAPGCMRWMPPEALQYRRFSRKSDVYAFGTVLWQMWADGKVPYWTVSEESNVARMVVAGARPERPPECPENVYAIMQSCWPRRYEERASFAQLKLDLQDALAAYQRPSEDLSAPHVPIFECCICQEMFPETSGFSCAGDAQAGVCELRPPHFVCNSCGVGFVKACCSDQMLEREQINCNMAVSARGHVPCPLFSQGCSDGCLSKRKIRKALESCEELEEVSQAYDSARERVAVEVYREEEEQRLQALRAAEVERDDVERARMLVEAALEEGGCVRCPGCKGRGVKDDKCMHILCFCGVHYCYVCGVDRYPGVRHHGPGYRPENKRPCGCDTKSFYLESYPGWEGFADVTRRETAGDGALNEFHRRRCARFIRVVKEQLIQETTWELLKQRYSTMLQDVVAGRSISWEEIDTAEHAQFGQGRARELLVALEHSLVESLR